MERTKLLFLIFIGILLAIGIAFLVLYYYRKRLSIQGDSPSVSGKTEEPSPCLAYRYADILSAADLLGKSVQSSGVNAKYFTEKAGYTTLEFEGPLCGKAANGTAFFSAEGENGEQITDRVYIHSYEYDFETCKEALTALYGAPVQEWEEPFVRVKGGAVSNAVFDKGDMRLHLSQGSEREYVELEFSYAK